MTEDGLLTSKEIQTIKLSDFPTGKNGLELAIAKAQHQKDLLAFEEWKAEYVKDHYASIEDSDMWHKNELTKLIQLHNEELEGLAKKIFEELESECTQHDRLSPCKKADCQTCWDELKERFGVVK